MSPDATDGLQLATAPSWEGKLPPVLYGAATPAVWEGVGRFYYALADVVESWVKRRPSPHTQRAYREDLMTFIGWTGIQWPGDAHRLLTVSIAQVHSYRDWLISRQAAPNTINRRISSLSSLFKYIGACAAVLRLPITIPNPARAQFIGRSISSPVQETKALSKAATRQLLCLPSGDTLEAFRDRALLATFLYTGMRLGTACALQVEDFFRDETEATLRLREKGGKYRTIGLHSAAAEAIQDYLTRAGLTDGPLFRSRRGPRSPLFSDRPMSRVSMYGLIVHYLSKLPGALRVTAKAPAPMRVKCLYSPHSLRATTATLLLDAAVDITKVQALLGHRHVTTTQIYDKRRRSTSESASHDVPL